MPAATVSTAASGSSDVVHGNGIHTWLHAHSAAKPTVPTAAPATAPNVSCRRVVSAQAAPSTTSASTR